MTRRPSICAALAALALASCDRPISAEDAAQAWQVAANAFDEAQLDAAIDKAAVQESYSEQLKAHMIRALEADPAIVDAGMVEAIFEEQVSSIEALARDYASTRGTRALLTRCDPRSQSDNGYRRTPEVLGEVTAVSEDRAEYRCPMPNSTDSIRAIMVRTDDGWVISRVELPLDFPKWAGPEEG